MSNPPAAIVDRMRIDARNTAPSTLPRSRLLARRPTTRAGKIHTATCTSVVVISPETIRAPSVMVPPRLKTAARVDRMVSPGLSR